MFASIYLFLTRKGRKNAAIAWPQGLRLLISRWAERNSGKPEAQAGGMGFWPQKRGFLQLAVRASKHGAIAQWWGKASRSKRAARQTVVRCSFDCAATCVPNRIATDGFFHGQLPGQSRRSNFAFLYGSHRCVNRSDRHLDRLLPNKLPQHR